MASAAATADCHIIAHAIGSSAYDVLGRDAVDAIAAGTIECGGGYVHAVLMRVMVDSTAETAAASIAAALPICREPGVVADPALELECLHGLGHGVLARTQSVEASIAGCDAIVAPTGLTIDLCIDGVIMEAFDPNESGRASLRADGDPLAACLPMATPQHRARCAHYGVRALPDLPAVLDRCAALEEPFVREDCFAGGVSNFWSEAVRDPAGTAATCAAAAAYRAICERHLAAALGFVSARLAPEVGSFCDLVSDRAACYRTAAEQLQILHGEASAADDCRALALPASVEAACLAGARGAE
jgi:hypothetical protein